MSAIIHDDGLVHYEVLGHGKPVIFLHSWIGSWRYWVPSMQFTSSRFRAYAIDFWGFGASNKNAIRYSLERQVDLLAGFIRQMGINRITLVGHGLGSIIGIYFAADFTNIVERMMVVSFPMGIQTTDSRLASQSPVDSASWLFGNDPMFRNSQEDAEKADQSAISKSLDEFREVDWRQLINRLSVPSLWVYGKNDRTIGSPGVEQFNLLPGLSNFQLFEGSGHYPMLDEPGKFNRLLTDFINLPPGDDPSQMAVKEIWRRKVR
jgi:3-oxoadipate enol-lactonase